MTAVKTKSVFVHTFARCFCLFLAFYAGLFVCFAFTKIADDTVTRAFSLKTAESVIDRFIFTDFNS